MEVQHCGQIIVGLRGETLLKLSHQGRKVAPGILPSSSGSVFIFYSNLVDQTVRNLPAMWETRIDPWVGKIPWRRQRQPSPVFLPGEFHGQSSRAGYSPCIGLQRVGHNCVTDSFTFSGKKSQSETLTMDYTATVKTGFQKNEKYVSSDTRVYTALMRAGFRFPTEPQMIIPILKTGETGCRCLWGVRKRKGGVCVRLHPRGICTQKVRLPRMLGNPPISELDKDPHGQQLLHLLYNLWGLQGILSDLRCQCVHLRKSETTVLLLEEFPIQLETFKLWYSKQNPPKSAKVQGRRMQHPLSRGRDMLWNLNPFFGQMMPYIRPECTQCLDSGSVLFQLISSEQNETLTIFWDVYLIVGFLRMLSQIQGHPATTALHSRVQWGLLLISWTSI